MLYRLLVGSHLLILREIPVKCLGLVSWWLKLSLSSLADSHSRLKFLIVFIGMQQVEMTMGIVLQLYLNLSDAIGGLFTAGWKAFEWLFVVEYLLQGLSAQFWKATK